MYFGIFNSPIALCFLCLGLLRASETELCIGALVRCCGCVVVFFKCFSLEIFKIKFVLFK